VPLYWGDLHGHSKLSGGLRTPEEYFAYAREEAKLDFCALADQADEAPCSKFGLMSEEQWEAIKRATAEANEPGRFVTLLGVQRSVPSWEGANPANLCVYFRGDDGPFPIAHHPQRDWFRPGAVRADSEMTKLWSALKAGECLRAVVHSGSARHGLTWPEVPTKYRFDLIEVYSKWGACDAPGAPFPILDGSGLPPRPAGSAQDALAAGFQPGFIAGSGTRFGMPGSNVWENDWANALRYEKGGLTAIRAESRTREALFDALKSRHCYATTSERIRLRFSINDQPMGSAVGAATRVRVHVRAVGTRPIKRAEVFRNGELLHRRTGEGEHFDMYFDDEPPAESTWYYTRVTQMGEDYAWSSPIWVSSAQSAGQ